MQETQQQLAPSLSKRPAGYVLVAALTACLIPAWSPVWSQAPTHTLTSDRVNGIHLDLVSEIAPVELGPLIVRLRSPSHTLEILEHELRLGPVDDRVDAAVLRARYRGEAELVAELEVAGVTSEIDDHIEVPLQETEIPGRIEIQREGDGYRITTIEAPTHVEIEVESDLGNQLELLCRGFAVIALGTIDCAAVHTAMSRLRLPLPEAGQSYYVLKTQLTEGERRQLEAYLNQRR